MRSSSIFGLPGLDGISILERWRGAGRSMPVIVLTARDRWSEKVSGIDAGADDYVTKPFQMEEVLARVRAVIRRASGHASAEFTCGPLTVDTRRSRVSVDGAPVKLTAQEYRLLNYLIHHRDQVVSRTELTEHIYNQDFDRDSNTIEVFIGRAGVWIVLALIASGALLSTLFENYVERNFQQTLGTFQQTLIAVSDITADGALVITRPLPDPRFDRPLSGWYWQVNRGERIDARSRSLWDQELALSQELTPGQQLIPSQQGEANQGTSRWADGPDGERLSAR